ncbi:GNAT family N-acetyltransferase [Luteococcus sediminum]|uniref:GNAT family N-acetyltransferase n=1 Tax=Luteococcus sp. TaxID=1969402 RepID=UPI003735CF3F
MATASCPAPSPNPSQPLSPSPQSIAPDSSVVIRTARSEDLAAITAIYNEAGVGTTASYDLEPVTVDNRREWLERHHADGHPVLVATVDDQVLGFAGYGVFREKAGYAHTVEHSVYVGDGARALGVGRLLMLALVDLARGNGVHTMVGVLDADNEASINFHRRLGFEETGRLRQVGRKFDRWLDAVLVQLMLDAPDSAPRAPLGRLRA